MHLEWCVASLFNRVAADSLHWFRLIEDITCVCVCFSVTVGTGVTTYSLHPGVIRTELGRHFWPTIPLWKRAIFKTLSFWLKSPREGAQTTIHCAVEESLADVSGLYYRSDAIRACFCPTLASFHGGCYIPCLQNMDLGKIYSMCVINFVCGFGIFFSVLATVTAPQKLWPLRARMMHLPRSCGTWVPPWLVWHDGPDYHQDWPSL